MRHFGKSNRFGVPAPKAGALPTALHPVIKLFYPAGRILPNQVPYQLGHTRIYENFIFAYFRRKQKISQGRKKENIARKIDL